MKTFFLKFFLLVSLMFICVLLGMQMANDGINSLKGYKDTNFKEALTLNENEEGKMEINVMGNEINSHNIELKKEKLEELKAYNFFSSLGKKFADGLSALSEKTIQKFEEIFDSMR